MAAGWIPAPGSKLGPCARDCKHRDCADSRRVATALCRLCRRVIGYDTPYYDHADPVHAECEEIAAEHGN